MTPQRWAVLLSVVLAAAQGALAVDRLVREGGNIAHMDGIDRQRPTGAQFFERLRHNPARRGKCHRPVELFGWALIRPAYPGRPECFRMAPVLR